MKRVVAVAVVALVCPGALDAGSGPPRGPAGNAIVVRTDVRDGRVGLVLSRVGHDVELHAAAMEWAWRDQAFALSAHPDGVHLETGGLTIVGDPLVLRAP